MGDGFKPLYLLPITWFFATDVHRHTQTVKLLIAGDACRLSSNRP